METRDECITRHYIFIVGKGKNDSPSHFSRNGVFDNWTCSVFAWAEKMKFIRDCSLFNPRSKLCQCKERIKIIYRKIYLLQISSFSRRRCALKFKSLSFRISCSDVFLPGRFPVLGDGDGGKTQQCDAVQILKFNIVDWRRCAWGFCRVHTSAQHIVTVGGAEFYVNV